MAERIENIDILFMRRTARKRGPTSSDQINDIWEELAHDLSEFSSQWNSLVVPLTTALPDGTEGDTTTAIDAFENGLDGKNMFVVQDATSDTDSLYFNVPSSRPRSIFEQFDNVYTTINSAIADLQNQIGFNSLTALQVAVADSANNFTSNNVEGVLAEIASTLTSLQTADPTSGLGVTSITLGSGDISFAASQNVMIITGDAGTNTIGTITGAPDGRVLTLIFVDGLVTITDDASHSANTVDLSASFTSVDNTVLQIAFDGTSWYEVSRSTN